MPWFVKQSKMRKKKEKRKKKKRKKKLLCCSTILWAETLLFPLPHPLFFSLSSTLPPSLSLSPTFSPSLPSAHLFLYISITQLEAQEVLKGFKECLVEVEVWQLTLGVEKRIHHVMDGADRLLADRCILVACSLGWWGDGVLAWGVGWDGEVKIEVK